MYSLSVELEPERLDQSDEIVEVDVVDVALPDALPQALRVHLPEPLTRLAMVSAASASIEGMAWLYTSIVKAKVEWTSLSLTIFGWMPEARARVACV
jgi:hypothetical protein